MNSKLVPTALIITLVSGWISFAFWPKYDAKLLNFWLLSVGQGESALIREPSGNWILYDGGPDESVLNQIGKIMPPWERRISLIILSHPHADHLRGLIYLIDRYQFGQIWTAYSTFQSPEVTAWQSKLKQHNLQPLFLTYPHTDQLGQLILAVVYPLEGSNQAQLSYPHSTDLVVSIQYQKPQILLTGDLGAPELAAILNSCQLPLCQLSHPVLQVPHHGGKDSLSPRFVSAVNPQIALIPVGLNNMYHHPTPATLALLAQSHLSPLRTDQSADPLFIAFNQLGPLIPP